MKINTLPKIGIRPVIDGRRMGVRESLEEQTMNMAKATAIAAGLAEPDHRREHRRAVSGSQRSGCFRADRHRPGPVPDYLRGELHRS